MWIFYLWRIVNCIEFILLTWYFIRSYRYLFVFIDIIVVIHFIFIGIIINLVIWMESFDFGKIVIS